MPVDNLVTMLEERLRERLDQQGQNMLSLLIDTLVTGPTTPTAHRRAQERSGRSPMSAAARKRLSLATKKRWAAAKKAGKAKL